MLFVLLVNILLEPRSAKRPGEISSRKQIINFDIISVHADDLSFVERGASERSFATHYCDVIMGAMASQITSLTIVYSTAYSGADQGKHPSSSSLAFLRVIHWWPVNYPHKWTVSRKMFPFDDVIMTWWAPQMSGRVFLFSRMETYSPFCSMLYA